MKFKKFCYGLSGFLLVLLLIIIALPVFVGGLIYTPIDYIKFKRSAYQKDFPRKYSWLCGCHVDNGVYSLVKEKGLPVKYMRSYEDYELAGDFIYKDTVLNFSQPFFFDEKKEMWLFWPGDKSGGSDAEDDENAEDDVNTDDCLSEEESREYILEQFVERYPDTDCTKTVFFYEDKFVKDVYGKNALEKMEQNASFIVYKRRKLNDAILKYISEN